MVKTRYGNTDRSQDETRPVRVGGDEYGGDMGYTQISARAHKKLVVTDPLTLTPVACGVQEHTDRRKEWTYVDKLPHELMVPHPDNRQCVLLCRRSSSSSKIMTEVDNRDRGPTEDEGTVLGVMGWCGGGTPVVTELGTKGVEMILEQSQVHGTNHPGRMMGTVDMILNPTRSYTPGMKAESGDVETEEPRPTTRPNKFHVPGRIDVIDTYRQTVVMERTDEPKQKERLTSAGCSESYNYSLRINS